MTRTRDPFLFGKGSCDGLDVLCHGIAGAMRMRRPMPRGLLTLVCLRRGFSECQGVAAAFLIPERRAAADERSRKALVEAALRGCQRLKYRMRVPKVESNYLLVTVAVAPERLAQDPCLVCVDLALTCLSATHRRVLPRESCPSIPGEHQRLLSTAIPPTVLVWESSYIAASVPRVSSSKCCPKPFPRQRHCIYMHRATIYMHAKISPARRFSATKRRGGTPSLRCPHAPSSSLCLPVYSCTNACSTWAMYMVW